VSLSLVVLRSGTVKEAAISPPPGSEALSACILERVKALRFRSHPDDEVRINVPFTYRITSPVGGP
jgi:hypothetical protein